MSLTVERTWFVTLMVNSTEARMTPTPTAMIRSTKTVSSQNSDHDNQIMAGGLPDDFDKPVIDNINPDLDQDRGQNRHGKLPMHSVRAPTGSPPESAHGAFPTGGLNLPT